MSAMKKKLPYSKRTGKPIKVLGEQLLELTLTLAENEGNPVKGQKSYATRFLQSRYKEASPIVFFDDFPWIPEWCLLEGMFLINTTPFGSHKCYFLTKTLCISLI